MSSVYAFPFHKLKEYVLETDLTENSDLHYCDDELEQIDVDRPGDGTMQVYQWVDEDTTKIVLVDDIVYSVQSYTYDTERMELWVDFENYNFVFVYSSRDTFFLVSCLDCHPTVATMDQSWCNSDGSTDSPELPVLTKLLPDSLLDFCFLLANHYVANQEH